MATYSPLPAAQKSQIPALLPHHYHRTPSKLYPALPPAPHQVPNSQPQSPHQLPSLPDFPPKKNSTHPHPHLSLAPHKHNPHSPKHPPQVANPKRATYLVYPLPPTTHNFVLQKHQAHPPLAPSLHENPHPPLSVTTQFLQSPHQCSSPPDFPSKNRSTHPHPHLLLKLHKYKTYQLWPLHLHRWQTLAQYLTRLRILSHNQTVLPGDYKKQRFLLCYLSHCNKATFLVSYRRHPLPEH